MTGGNELQFNFILLECMAAIDSSASVLKLLFLHDEQAHEKSNVLWSNEALTVIMIHQMQNEIAKKSFFL